MRLGGSVAGTWKTPEEWGELLEKSRFAAVTSPVDSSAPRALAAQYFDIARQLGVLVAEVGVWKNVLSPDPAQRQKNQEYAIKQLAFAEEMGVSCCVNIVGSRGSVWDGANPDNYSEETYDLIVGSVRDIIDKVKPVRAFYTLEPMPWMPPDGPEEYLQLIRDIDRKQFAVHMDFVNMISSPRRSLFAYDFIEECFSKLGPYTKSCHIKDSVMEEKYTAVIREAQPGKGCLDFARVLASIAKHLPPDAPVLMEHMSTFEEYAAAYDHVASCAHQAGIPIR